MFKGESSRGTLLLRLHDLTEVDSRLELHVSGCKSTDNERRLRGESVCVL